VILPPLLRKLILKLRYYFVILLARSLWIYTLASSPSSLAVLADQGIYCGRPLRLWEHGLGPPVGIRRYLYCILLTKSYIIATYGLLEPRESY
jgi:hypothetical protein